MASTTGRGSEDVFPASDLLLSLGRRRQGRGQDQDEYHRQLPAARDTHSTSWHQTLHGTSRFPPAENTMAGPRSESGCAGGPVAGFVYAGEQ